jgi:hypothetical protein
VLSKARAGDAVVFYVYCARVPFEYYADRLNLRKDGVEFVELASAPWIAGNLQPEPSRDVLNGLASRHSRVWLVRLQDGGSPGQPLRRFEQSQLVQQTLAEQYTMTEHASFPGGIRVQLWTR